jgi:hypothetical protein
MKKFIIAFCFLSISHAALANGNVTLAAKLVGASNDPKAEVATAEITVTNGTLNLKSCAPKIDDSDPVCDTISVPSPKLFNRGGMEEVYSNYIVTDSILLVVNDAAMGQKIIPKYTLLFGYSMTEHKFKEAIDLTPDLELQIK